MKDIEREITPQLRTSALKMSTFPSSTPRQTMQSMEELVYGDYGQKIFSLSAQKKMPVKMEVKEDFSQTEMLIDQ